MAKQIEVPETTKVRKPTPKKEFSLSDYKKKINATEIPDKPLRWIKSDSALQEATGLPGFGVGYVNVCRGFSNVGKSTAVCKGVVEAQKMGILPIIIDTENNLGITRLKTMGFDWEGNYILVDNEFLLENFGKKQDKTRNEASIEDLAKCIYFFLDEQENGNLPFELLFAIDSIGTLNCIKTINAAEKGTGENNMYNANAYEKCFMSLLNNTIPNSRKIDKPYTNTIIAVQKVWYDGMLKILMNKGGQTFAFGCRLLYEFGGTMSASVKRISGTSKGRELAYAVETRARIVKNHIDGEFGGISMEGKVISTPHGFISPNGLEEYKKKNILYFRNLFGENINAEDISDKYEEIKKDVNLNDFNSNENFDNE